MAQEWRLNQFVMADVIGVAKTLSSGGAVALFNIGAPGDSCGA